MQLPTLLELLHKYADGDIDETIKMFKYIDSNNQVKQIHIDELKKEMIFNHIYPASARATGFRGVKTRQDNGFKS
jgi:hypothetical protein